MVKIVKAGARHNARGGFESLHAISRVRYRNIRKIIAVKKTRLSHVYFLSPPSFRRRRELSRSGEDFWDPSCVRKRKHLYVYFVRDSYRTRGNQEIYACTSGKAGGTHARRVSRILHNNDSIYVCIYIHPFGLRRWLYIYIIFFARFYIPSPR